jgi:polysaccharide export outer membrane protein
MRLAGLALATAAASGCSLTPRAGPDDSTIQQKAAVYVQNEDSTLGYSYALIDVTRGNLPFITQDPARDGSSSFGMGSGAAPTVRLGVGDVIQLTIFESQAGGLFIPEDAGARPGNFVELPPQRVAQNGNINVPYAGTIRAADNTPSAVEDLIERRLADRAIEPQVTLEVVEQNFARVSVTGSVEEPNNFALRDGGDRILDVIAASGGITGAAGSTFVTLTRGGSSARVAYETILGNPRENVFLRPGDFIDVSVDSKRFFAYGASGLVGEFNFSSETYSLNEAMAQINGLTDTQADPRQVLIYRDENITALQDMGIGAATIEGDVNALPTIFRADFRKPDIFFLADNFRIRDGDIIYVSNADIIELEKFFDATSTVLGGPVNVDDDVDAVINIR